MDNSVRPEWRNPDKNNKVLEASDLRAFYKYYIIINQQFINVNDELMYYFGLGSARLVLAG